MFRITNLSNSSSSKTQLDRMGLLEHMFTILWWRPPHQEQVAGLSPFSFCLCRDCRTSSNTAGLAPPQCTGNDQDSSTCGDTPCQGIDRRAFDNSLLNLARYSPWVSSKNEYGHRWWKAQGHFCEKHGRVCEKMLGISALRQLLVLHWLTTRSDTRCDQELSFDEKWKVS